MIHLYDLSFDELAELVAEYGQPAYRATQIWHWLYTAKAGAIDDMTNLPKALRQRLAATARVGCMAVVAEQTAHDGTHKRLYRLPDGQLIESVLMRYADGRRTACISTQAGCAMGCVFCATGQMGFARHLSVGEILEQVVHFARQLEADGERLSNVVLMGMGEPLHNYDATLAAITRMTAPDGLGIGQRHITLSSVGLVPAIRRFADEKLQVGLAISLHATDDAARSALLPVNHRWPIEELMEACRYYIEQTGRRVTFEWALIHGKTDTLAEAEALGQLLSDILCHVNVIPLNPPDGDEGTPSDPERVQRFMDTLRSYGVSSSVRVRRGIEIDAGCGQLKAAVLRQPPGD
ncbi:MAG: 23S rRNA (adenine(2503)-C(2))-methyltransferase RlmN [Chloroflexi bacterium]|nr:23S rRNA (adenine(2503)-C(2))-methyltransferase RlmN [Chloroflexota bacterium]